MRLLQDTTINQTRCCIFSAPLLSRTVCYFYHSPCIYFPCVFRIYLSLTRGSKKLKTETAEIMKRGLPILWLPVDWCAAPAVTATAFRPAY